MNAVVQSFARSGWRVIVVTQLPNYPAGRVFAGYEDKTGQTIREEDAEVVRLKPWIVSKGSFILRLMSESWFCWQAYRVTRQMKYDVVYATCPYMFTAWCGLLAAKRRKCPLVVEFRDLTWQYIKSSGKAVFKADAILERIMLWVTKRADLLVAVSDGQLAYFRAHAASPARALVVPNGISEEFVTRACAKGPATDKSSRLQVVYSGLIGIAQGLEVLIHVSRLLPDVDFHVVGEGVDRARLMQLAAKDNLSNIRFPGFLQQNELMSFYQQADVLVAHLKNDPAYEIARPSKIWEYMAVGKPVIYGGKGEGARIVEQSGGGIVVPPEQPSAMANAIMRIRKNTSDALLMGARGREYVLANFMRSQLNKPLVETVEEMIAQ